MGDKIGADLVFSTTAGEKVTHIGHELKMLSDRFGKRFCITPTINRKQIATAVGKRGTEADVRATANFMLHSVDVHRSTYQQKVNNTEAVDRYYFQFYKM